MWPVSCRPGFCICCVPTCASTRHHSSPAPAPSSPTLRTSTWSAVQPPAISAVWTAAVRWRARSMLSIAPSAAVRPARCVLLACPVISTWAPATPATAVMIGASAAVPAGPSAPEPFVNGIAAVALPQSSFCSGRMSLESSSPVPLSSSAAVLAKQLPVAAS